jgi:SAM-dependent methyltransferase
LLSAPEEYAEEAAFFLKILQDSGLPPDPTLLELGCGAGSNALHLKPHFSTMTLTDLSPSMLAVSQALNPECEHRQGDMRTLRLGRVFDVVFVHDAVMYMTSQGDLQQAIETASIHCKPGGLVLFAPDHVRETFKPSTDYGGEDGDGRSLRYLEWNHDPDPNDDTYTADFVYMLREGSGPVQVEYETHTFGLFDRDVWLHLLAQAGFLAQVIPDPFDREIFLAHKG